jgi:mRNA interferase MazF
MPTPRRGEVWLVDFGLAGKVRPALVTTLRDSPFEVSVRVPFLKPGAFLVQGITTFPTSHLFQRLGYVRADVFDEVFTGLLRWLGYFQ